MQVNHENPYLLGNYAPVHDELDVQNLKVIGEIPKDLNGVYMRNGPNPAFEPLSYTYPFDGDGMLHAIYLQDGRARYRNRLVETKQLLAEQRVGHALYGGIMQPIMPDPKLIGTDGDFMPVKAGRMIHIIRHANQYLALHESCSAYEVTPELITLGEWNPTGQIPIAVNAHTRLDPLTGDLFLFTYNLEPPYLVYYHIDNAGRLINEVPIDMPHASMMHDLVLTKNYIIFFDCSVIFNFEKFSEIEASLKWQPELGAHIGVLSRTGKSKDIIWFNTAPFFIYHFANGYEHNDEIIIDYVRYAAFRLKPEEYKKDPVPMLHRMTIDINKKILKDQQLDDHNIEFPRINEKYNSLSHRFIYTPTWTKQRTEDYTSDAFNALIKYDLQTGTSQLHDFGKECQIGEAVFAPRTNCVAEDDGYIMLFIYNKKENNSDFILLNAQDFTGKAIAQIKLPRRVPQGLHGSWMPQVF